MELLEPFENNDNCTNIKLTSMHDTGIDQLKCQAAKALNVLGANIQRVFWFCWSSLINTFETDLGLDTLKCTYNRHTNIIELMQHMCKCNYSLKS
jgi:hypothetical protein